MFKLYLKRTNSLADSFSVITKNLIDKNQGNSDLSKQNFIESYVDNNQKQQIRLKYITNLLVNNRFKNRGFVVWLKIFNRFLQTKISVSKPNYIIKKYLISLIYSNYRNFFFRNTDFKPIVYAYYELVVFKNPLLYATALTKIYRYLKVKFHKKLIFFFSKFFNKYSTLMYGLFGISGLKVRIKGKVAVFSNLKKKKFTFNYGKTSTTGPSTLTSYYNYKLVSVTGVMGLKILLNSY